MKSTRATLLFAALTLTLLLIAGLTWAQGSDTPIIIADGSLTMESTGVPWSSYTTAGNTKRHPNAGKTVRSVDLTVNGNTQTIAFTGQQCTVTAVYGNTTITVSTDGTGKALSVTTDFAGSFHAGASGNQLAHNNANGQMGAITVKKGTQSAFSGTGNGHSRIVIHYQ
jgi:hypothetical protein